MLTIISTHQNKVISFLINNNALKNASLKSLYSLTCQLGVDSCTCNKSAEMTAIFRLVGKLIIYVDWYKPMILCYVLFCIARANLFVRTILISTRSNLCRAY